MIIIYVPRDGDGLLERRWISGGEKGETIG